MDLAMAGTQSAQALPPPSLAPIEPGADALGTLSKGEFARLINVSPGRVSQYITERKLTGDALVGEGREQRINVEIAKAQLRDRLDINQRCGNGLDTRLKAAVPAPPPALPSPASPPTAPVGDGIEDQIKRERLETLQRQNRKLAEEEAARSGRYVDAESVKQQLGRLAGQMVTVFESALPELATAIAAQWKLPQRDVLHLIRAEFRKIRMTTSASLSASTADVPATIEEAIEDDDADEEDEPQG